MVAIFVFKQPCTPILLIIEQLTVDAWVEIVISHLWRASFPGSVIFWCLRHLAEDSLHCGKAPFGSVSGFPKLPTARM